jgi:hypothetical protein
MFHFKLSIWGVVLNMGRPTVATISGARMQYGAFIFRATPAGRGLMSVECGVEFI